MSKSFTRGGKQLTTLISNGKFDSMATIFMHGLPAIERTSGCALRLEFMLFEGEK